MASTRCPSRARRGALASRGAFAKRLGSTRCGRRGGGMVRNAIGGAENSSVYGGIDVSNLPSASRESPCPSKCDETSAQCLAQIHNQVVGILNPDRNANQSGRDPQPQPFFFRNVRMSHRGRMRSESLRTTQAYRELDHFKPIQDSKGFGLSALHFEAESGAWTLALVLKDWTIGMALRQESQIPDRCDLRMSIEEACDLARAFRRGRHSELQGLE